MSWRADQSGDSHCRSAPLVGVPTRSRLQSALSPPPVSSDGKNGTCDHIEIPGATLPQLHDIRFSGMGGGTRLPGKTGKYRVQIPYTKAGELGTSTAGSSLELTGGASRTRTCDPLIMSQRKMTFLD